VRRTASAFLGIAITAGLITGCDFLDTVPEPDSIGVVTKLPGDTSKATSVKQAGDFKSWLDKHGSESQKSAAVRVQRIIGEWDGNTGNAYISTDINGGPTPVEDPMATATVIAEAFDAYADSKQGYVSVYDVFGNVLISNARF